jgi:hypothetical protein
LDFQLLNPAIAALGNLEIPTRLLAIRSTHVWVACGHIAIACNHDNIQVEQICQLVEALLASLRVEFRQPEIARRVIATEQAEIDDLPEPSGPPSTVVNLRSDLVRTAVRFDELTQNGSTGTARLSDDLLIDSIHAFYRGEHRTAILYSAFAVESIANEKLEAEYERLKSLDPSSRARVRLLRIRVSRTVEQLTDPIYAALVNSKRFGILLHEAPLYLLGKSLLDEQKVLYDRGTRLYNTRNKIVHGQEANARGELLSLDRAGASEAVTAAILIFQWFGAGAGFAFPRGGFEDSQHGFDWLT